MPFFGPFWYSELILKKKVFLPLPPSKKIPFTPSFESTLVSFYQTIIFWTHIFVGFPFGSSCLIVPGGKMWGCVCSSYHTLLFLGLFLCHWELRHNGPVVCAYFPRELEGEAYVASLETEIMVEYRFRKCSFWNPCCSSKRIHAEISLLLSISQPLTFWSFYLPIHHLLSCSELSAITGESHKTGHKVHYAFQRPSLSCLVYFSLLSRHFISIWNMLYLLLNNHVVHWLWAGPL